MPQKEVDCENCATSYQSAGADELQAADEQNPYPWYELTFGTCCSIIATVQIVPDDKPVEPSAAVTDEPVQPNMIVGACACSSVTGLIVGLFPLWQMKKHSGS